MVVHTSGSRTYNEQPAKKRLKYVLQMWVTLEIIIFLKKSILKTKWLSDCNSAYFLSVSEHQAYFQVSTE